jgi:glyoxylase I family protein
MAITIQGHAPLFQVFDMPTSIAFYCKVLGFEIVATDRPGDRFDWALLRLNHVELMLNTAYEEHERPPVPDPARALGHADTTIFFNCPDVDEAYAYLRSQGVDVKEPVTRSYGWRQLYLKDPDGFELCFHCPVS